MSKNLPEQDTSEEVDLGQLFNLIGDAFSRVFNFIGSIFKSLFSVFVYALKAVIDNFKLIMVVVIISGVIGYGLEKSKPKLYSSQMLVKPYFDSKYQLVNNINYFNALLSDQDYKSLSTIFEIDSLSASTINGFEVNPGPESENELVQNYGNYITSIDSLFVQDIDFEQYIENRNIYSGDFFEIKVFSSKRDIFKSLEQGLNASFENTFSAKKIKKRDSLIFIQKESLIKSIGAIDSLQLVYINVLKEESKSSSKNINLSEALSLQPNKSETKEFELLNKKLELEKELLALQEKKVEEDVFFDTLSGFQGIGTEVNNLREKYSLIFPVLSFLILCLIFMAIKTVKFVKNYEA
jgi:hypothetical protein